MSDGTKNIKKKRQIKKLRKGLSVLVVMVIDLVSVV